MTTFAGSGRSGAGSLGKVSPCGMNCIGYDWVVVGRSVTHVGRWRAVRAAYSYCYGGHPMPSDY